MTCPVEETDEVNKEEVNNDKVFYESVNTGNHIVKYIFIIKCNQNPFLCIIKLLK